MEKNVELVIMLPDRIYKTAQVAKVVIPAAKGMMTILPDRAPTTVLLEYGLLNILEGDNSVAGRYFIKGGVADIAGDKCIVATEKVFDYDDINSEKIAVMLSQHERNSSEVQIGIPAANETDIDSDTAFYRVIQRHYDPKKVFEHSS